MQPSDPYQEENHLRLPQSMQLPPTDIARSVFETRVLPVSSSLEGNGSSMIDSLVHKSALEVSSLVQ
jgi:hypothetical protein